MIKHRGMDPDLDIIKSLQDGNDLALNELMKRHQDSVFRFIYRFCHNKEDTAELTTETFTRVYFGAAKFKPKAKVKTWIFTIATNLCRDRHRKKKLPLTLSLDWEAPTEDKETLKDEIPDESEMGAVESIVDKERHQQIENEIEQLPHALKVPFILFALEDRSYKECAEILDTSIKTVETRIYRARKLLKKALEGVAS